MDDLRQFIEDCKVYRRAMDRMKTLGIHDEQKAIIYLQREIDHYRDKIRCMEERNNVRADLNDTFRYATMSIMPADTMEVKMPILESMPKDMRDRVYSIEQNSSGDIAVYFDTYFSNEDEKNEQPRDNRSKDDLQKH